jgi:hypothetical protein
MLCEIGSEGAYRLRLRLHMFHRLPLLVYEGQVMFHVPGDSGQHLPHRLRDPFAGALDKNDIPVELVFWANRGPRRGLRSRSIQRR